MPMKIYIYVGGKDKRDWAAEGINHFIKLIKPYAEVKIEILPADVVSTTRPSALFARAPADCPAILLDRTGVQYDSESFAARLFRAGQIGGKLAFFIGDHSGFSDEVLEAADNVISFSNMTFGHRLSILILLEQLYRCFDIRSGRKYHR